MSFLRPRNAAVQVPDVLGRLSSVLGQSVAGDTVTLDFRWASPVEARQRLDQIQATRKELKKLRQEVQQEIRDVHAVYTARRGNIGAGVIGLVGGSKRAARIKSNRREKLRIEEETALARHQTACKVIDSALQQLDTFEGRIAAWLHIEG